MKKSLLLIGLSLLFAVSCNQSNKNGQQKENAEPVETVQQNKGFDLFSAEDFVDLINHNDEAAAAKCGMTFLYQDEVEEDMEGYESVEGDEVYEGDAGFQVVVFGKDIEKGDKLDFGYDLKNTSDHAYYYEVVTATSINQNLCFINQEDANQFYEMLSQKDVIEGERKFSVTKKEYNGGGEYLLLECLDDSNLVFSIDAPVIEEGVFYIISIYQYV
ncbi:MAG: hypothetical protein IKT08_05120 [Bacteroidales bacterium]|nr:hypothetical protein [Bacteroidales bacterium]